MRVSLKTIGGATIMFLLALSCILTKAENANTDTKKSDAVAELPIVLAAICPFAQKSRIGTKLEGITNKIQIVNEVSGSVANYAAKRLSRDLKILVGVSSELVDKPSNTATLVIKLALHKKTPAEGYELRSFKKNGQLVYDLKGNDPSGVLYGTYTICQILYSASTSAGLPSAPIDVNILDWPAMKTRLLPTEIYRLPADDPKLEAKKRRLDWSSFWRFNGFWISINASPHRNIPAASEGEMKRLSNLADERGMVLYGQFGFYSMVDERGDGEGMCPCETKTIDFVRQTFAKSAEAGCRGLVIQFDDLTKEMENHYKQCPKCSKRFSSLAEWELSFIKVMVDVAKQHKIQKLIVCPTPYGRGSADRKRYENYFRDLCLPDFMKNVLVFHCEITPEKVAHLKELGLKNYMWYDNGLWPSQMYYEGLYMGISKLHYIWYGHRATAKDAVAPVPGIMDALRSLPSYCEHVYPSPTASDVSRAMGGCLAWNPRETVDQQFLMRKTLVEFLYGLGTWDSYSEWESAMTSWFAAYRHNSLNVNIQKTEKEIASAEKSLSKLSTIYNSAVGLNAPLPYLKNEAEKTLREMRETIKSARSFLKVQGVLQPPVKMNTSTVPPQYATMCFEFDVFDGDRFLDDVKKDRFGIFRGGVPVLKKGPSGNAAFFNGKNNFFQVSATGCKDINPGTNSFSISCNVLLMGEFWNSFMDKRGSTRHIYRMPGWALGSDRLGKRWRFTIEDTEEKYITLTAISKDMLYKWHNLVAVRNVEKKKVFLYVDGILQDEQDDPTENISNNRPFLCGKDCMVGGGFWGLLDQVTYWNHALSDKEIKHQK